MTTQNTRPFSGFNEQDEQYIRLPETVFTTLLPQIDNLQEIRLLLYLFWHAEKQDSPIRYFKYEELQLDQSLLQMVGGKESLQNTLHSLVGRGLLLESDNKGEILFFFNSEQGRVACEAIQKDQWQEPLGQRLPIHLSPEKPNIYKLYEENIGAITPMMAEILKDDEATYPLAWIEEAIQIAVTRNARNWKFVQAILERWQKQGRGNEQNRRDDSQDPDSYRQRWGKNG